VATVKKGTKVMARASNIYLLYEVQYRGYRTLLYEHPCAAFTVKYESQEWAEKKWGIG
jgi:hypothetical protein